PRLASAPANRRTGDNTTRASNRSSAARSARLEKQSPPATRPQRGANSRRNSPSSTASPTRRSCTRTPRRGTRRVLRRRSRQCSNPRVDRNEKAPTGAFFASALPIELEESLAAAGCGLQRQEHRRYGLDDTTDGLIVAPSNRAPQGLRCWRGSLPQSLVQCMLKCCFFSS